MTSGQKDEVPIVHACALPDCATLTMGEFCLEHERQPAESARPREHVAVPDLVESTLDPVPR